MSTTTDVPPTDATGPLLAAARPLASPPAEGDASSVAKPVPVTPATDLDHDDAARLFPGAAAAGNPASPVPAVWALEDALLALRTAAPDPTADAQAMTAAQAAIAAGLPRDRAVSRAELERLAVARVANTQQAVAREHIDQALPAVEQALAAAERDLAASHAARREPRDPVTALTADEQAVLEASSAFADERRLMARSLIEQRRLLAAVEALTVAMTVGPDTSTDDLLHLAEHGTPAEQRRADALLARRPMRTDLPDSAAAVRDHQALRARHAAIRDGRVPPSVRAAEAAERAYLAALVERARFRTASVRALVQQGADLRGLFAAEPTPVDLARLRDQAVAAWAPIVLRAKGRK